MHWIVGGLSLFALTYLLLAGRPVIHADETWFVWTAQRVARGEVLYRDVYSVTTPIPTWIAAAVIRVFGTQILAVRALSAACFAGSVLVGWAVTARCGLGRSGRVLLVIGLFAYGSPVAHFVSVYSQLAILMTLLALWGLLAWLDRPEDTDRWLLVWSAVACGIAFGSKPNIGLAAFLIVLSVTVFRTQRAARGVRQIATNARLVVVAFGGLVVATLAPVVATGGIRAFVGDVVLEKPEYFHVLGGQILPGRDQLTELWATSTSSSARFLATQPLVILAVIGTIVWTARTARRDDRLRLVTLGLFAATAVLAIYPQGEPQHFTEAMPLALTTGAATLPMARPAARQQLGRHFFRPALVSMLGVLLSLCAAFVTLQAVERLPQAVGGDKPPHFAGTVAGGPTWRVQRRELALLRRVTGGAVFIVRPDASYFYLVGDLRNLTPYDFPVRSDFGAHSERGVAAAIASGHVRWACINTHSRHTDTPDVRPREIEQAVRQDLVPVVHLQMCDLYRAPTDLGE